MKIHKLSDVYMPVGVPQLTFVKRENLEHSIISWKMNKSKHLLIFGPSKSGKTTLWKQYVPQESIIKVSCNSSTSVGQVYSNILFELQTFYTCEIAEKIDTKTGIAAEISSAIGLFFAKASTNVESTSGNSNKMAPIASPAIEANLLVKYLKPSAKIVVIEDFHYVPDDFKEKLSQDLKAFSDDGCPWIIVGVQHKTSKLLSYNIDLQQRIAEIPVEGFSRDQLIRIIELGENALNISFSCKIKEGILKESYGSASLVQNLCQRICILKNISETSSEKLVIDDEDLLFRACKEIAYEAKKYYGDVVRRISLGGRSDGSTEKYKWFLKMIRDKEIPEYGLKNTEVFAYLKELGHKDIQQSSVTTGLTYLPKLLDRNGLPSIFDSDGTHFYLLDKYIKFVLNWAPELVDDLFNSGNEIDYEYNDELIPETVDDLFNSENKTDHEYNEYINILTNMKITYEDSKIKTSKAKTAEIQHPVFGKKTISENDEELIKIIYELKSKEVILSMDNDQLFGYRAINILFYLGFLYTKNYIIYEQIDNKMVKIYLTSKAKQKLHIK